MKNLKVEILSKEEMKLIHSTSLDVLSNVGILVSHPEARSILKKAGCTVDEKTNIVRIPAGLVEASVKSAPNSFIMHGRDPKKDVRMVSDGSKVNYFNLGIGTKVTDYRSPGHYETRSSTLEDTKNIATVLDSCENLDWVTQPVSAMDLADKKCARTLHEVDAIMSNTAKPYLLDPNYAYMHDYFDIMKACYSGDEEETRKKPFFMIGGCTSSPLQLDFPICELMLRAADYDMPTMTMTMAMSGTTAPLTAAGTLVIHNAEALATIVLVQCAKKGLPIFYGSCTTGFDFYSNTAPFGSPELALISSASAQMSQYYGIPCVTAGGLTDAITPNIQAGHEATLSSMMTTMAGSSNVFGPGILELGMSFSMEQAVIMNEAISMVRHAAGGIEVNADTLCYDEIKDVGVGNDYIARPETMNNLGRASHAELFNRDMYDQWAASGSLDVMDRAHAKVNDILATHRTTPIDAQARKEIDEIIRRADRKAAQN